MKKLVVSEVFYSIQGEGNTTGIPAVFLRLAGCNLLCEGNGWRCDTIEVWQKGKSKEFIDVIPDKYIPYLRNGAHLVITGGEPLSQQEAIVDYLNQFREHYKFTPIIEVETNGTIVPNSEMRVKIDYWNCSPKLSNSGMSYERRVNNVAIETIQKLSNPMFKFVIVSPDDVIGLAEEYAMINTRNITLMPAGDSVESIWKNRLVVAEICKEMGYRFSDRLHIMLWNKKTGV